MMRRIPITYHAAAAPTSPAVVDMTGRDDGHERRAAGGGAEAGAPGSPTGAGPTEPTPPTEPTALAGPDGGRPPVVTPQASEAHEAPPIVSREAGREEQLRRELQAALRQADQLARDLQTYRRHAEGRLSRIQTESRAEALAELGDVLRSLELALEAPPTDPAALREGVALVARSLETTLERNGLERIATVGEPFDPRLHEAVLTEPARDLAPGTVVRELAPGFRTAERVVRPARVSVAA